MQTIDMQISLLLTRMDMQKSFKGMTMIVDIYFL